MAEQPRVLVIDDDEVIRGFLCEALEDDGYDVRAAADGREALGLLRAWRPDLILLDLMMPVMDGWAFREAQRGEPSLADIPVIVLSAVRDLSARATALGAAALVAKPFDLDALLHTIDRVAHPV
jgi:CheY-like chemotaxis protein